MKHIRTRGPLLVLAGIIIFHTTGIKPAVYGEFGPGEDTYAQYVDYNKTSLAKAIESSENTVIYFGANRCPTCTKFEKNLLSTIDQIPSNLTILAADIDRDTQLTQEYNVLSQSTTVYLDTNGTFIQKKVGRDHSLEDIVRSLQN